MIESMKIGGRARGINRGEGGREYPCDIDSLQHSQLKKWVPGILERSSIRLSREAKNFCVWQTIQQRITISSYSSTFLSTAINALPMPALVYIPIRSNERLKTLRSQTQSDILQIASCPPSN